MNIHGQAVLQARRLVEAGVPLVTVFWQNDGITNVSVYWDTHNRNFIDLKTRLCPVTDQAFSALLDDLDSARHAGRDAGRLDRRDGPDAAGRAERGRRGRGAGATAATTGRTCFTTVLAGGGVRGGVVHGASDRYAAYPAANPRLAGRPGRHRLPLPRRRSANDHPGQTEPPAGRLRRRADSGRPVEWESRRPLPPAPSPEGGGEVRVEYARLPGSAGPWFPLPL